jgi:hypothetical protein
MCSHACATVPGAHRLPAPGLPAQAIFGLLDLLARWVADRLAAAKDAALTAAVQKGGAKWVPGAACCLA